jgi:hypothetical protein
MMKKGRNLGLAAFSHIIARYRGELKLHRRGRPEVFRSSNKLSFSHLGKITEGFPF